MYVINVYKKNHVTMYVINIYKTKSYNNVWNCNNV